MPFLRRSCNKTVVKITGKRLNRGAGYGLEAPDVYRLYGPDAFLQRITCKELVGDAATKQPLAKSTDEILSQPD